MMVTYLRAKKTDLARTVLRLFHPLLIPIYNILLFYVLGFINLYHTLIGLTYTILFSLLIPLLSLHWLHAKGAISSVDIPRQEDRVIPYLICATSLTACSIVLAYNSMYPVVYATLYSGAISLIICSLINFWWKISIHTTAIGCWLGCVLHLHVVWPFGFFTSGNSLTLSMVVLITGVVVSARIASGQHNLVQIYAGFLLGFLVGFCMLFMCALQ